MSNVFQAVVDKYKGRADIEDVVTMSLGLSQESSVEYLQSILRRAGQEPNDPLAQVTLKAFAAYHDLKWALANPEKMDVIFDALPERCEDTPAGECGLCQNTEIVFNELYNAMKENKNVH